MTALETSPEACVADVAETLMAQFQGVLSHAAVSSVVLRACDELSEQGVDGNFPARLMQLSQLRLTRLQMEVM